MNKDQRSEKSTADILTGAIIKGVGGFYTVLTPGGSTCVCKARGLFRKQAVTPIVGDRVEFSYSAPADECGDGPAEAPAKKPRDGGRAEAKGYLMRILPRKNELIRPACANIDRLFIVMAASRPLPDLLLTDKLLILAEKHGIEPVIIINKCDEAEESAIEELKSQYEPAGYPLFTVSAETGAGLEGVRELLKNAVICLAGQSAVGKSSLLNALIPGVSLEVGGLSEKTERGRHTTRHTQLIPLPDNAAVLDTPGFSFLDFLALEPEELRTLYPELRRQEDKCRFSGCMHVSEPGCFVKRELIIQPKEAGKTDGIHKERYERYVRLVNEAIEQRRHRYD